MARIRVRHVLAAAIAAVPGVAVASTDQAGLDFYQVRELPTRPVMTDAFNFGRFTFANPSGSLFGGPDANVDGTFLGGVNDPGDGVSWQNAANWTTNPQIPDGPTAIARLTAASGGASITLSGTTVTVSRLDMNDPLLNAVVGGTLNLAGPATIESQNTFFNPPSVIFSGINPLGTATTSISVGGTAGLTKIGNSPIQLGTPNSYTGATNINGGALLVAAGDSSLGAGSDAVNFNGGTLDVRTAAFSSNRTFNIGAAGGTIFWAGAAAAYQHSGDITGSGALTMNGAFGAPPPAILDSAKSFSGVFNVGGGRVDLQGSGAMANATAVNNSGTVGLIQGGGTPSGVNRLGNATPINSFGAAIRAEGNENAYSEQMGALNLQTSTSWVQIFSPGSGGTELNFASLNRVGRASVHFRGEGLGATPGANIATIRVGNGTSLLVGGIIPWAYGNDANQLFALVESQNNTLVTYGPNGITPVTSYVDINSSNANTNVLVSDGGGTVVGTVNANALVMRTTDGYLGTPMTLGGTGTVNLTTGVVLSGMAGFDAGGVINSSPGNVINANLNSGTNEFMIHTPSGITFNGILSGSGGLNKGGGRTAFFNNDNTYTGETYLTGFVRFNRSVLNGQASPFGNSTTPIILESGNFAPSGSTGVQGTMTAILAGDNNSGALAFSRPINVTGNALTLIRNFSDGELTFSGPINIGADADLQFQMFGAAALGGDRMIVNSVISGGGGVQVRDTASGGAVPTRVVRFTGNNTFTGGFDGGGPIELGHNNALGAGSVTQSNATSYSAFGGARNISNPLHVVAGAFGVGGTLPFEWSGQINGVGGEFAADITNTATTTFSGTFATGGMFKQGMGVLVVSGNNTFSGILNVGNGTNAGGMMILESNNAAGSTVGNSGVNSGENALALRGNITIPDELLILRGNGMGDQGALRNLSGNNTWGGTVLAGLPNTIGVDAGNLTLGKSWFSVGAGDNAGLAVATKTGPSTLTVGRETFTSGTSSFQGAIIADGLTINQGTVRIANVSTGGAGTPNVPAVSDVGTLSIAGGPGAPTARLDLGRNALVVNETNTSVADLQALVNAGRAGGAWTGNGITSSDLIGIPPAQADLFVFPTPASLQAGTTFLGDPVDGDSVLVFPALRGDANLDWRVNLADFNILAGNFGSSGRIWTGGDFNGDGLVNLADFNILAGNFGLQAGPDGPTDEDWAALGAVVPEPSSLALVGVGALAMLKRRRRA